MYVCMYVCKYVQTFKIYTLCIIAHDTYGMIVFTLTANLNRTHIQFREGGSSPLLLKLGIWSLKC